MDLDKGSKPKRGTKKQPPEEIIAATSLFDTDGNLSKRNIIQGSRRRKRTTSVEQDKRSKKPKLVKNAKAKLLPTPKTELDKVKNESIASRLHAMELIKHRHDNSVKELYHLELFQNMLDYNPKAFINDVRYTKYMSDYDVWEKLREQVDTSLVDLLSSVVLESNNAQGGDKVAVIHSGTGLRRHARQFRTLKDYLNSFATSPEDDDLTPEERDQLIEKERAIRVRLDNLQKQGGFSTQLQLIANRRPQQAFRGQYHQDALILHMQTASRLFHLNNKYKRNAAKKCARAVERYWENIKSQSERIEKEEQKRLRKLAKWTAQQVKHKWKVVERVCEARLKEMEKELQAKEGKRHLDLILEHSEHMLGVRKQELQHHRDDQSMEEETSSEDDEHVIEESEDERDHIIEDSEEEDDEELQALEEDQHLTVDELMTKYQHMQMEMNESEASVSTVEEEDAEFSSVGEEEEDVPIEDDGESEDDDIELNALNQEADLTVEELMKKYNTPQESIPDTVTQFHTKVPSLLRGTLREYQHVGLDWMASLYNNGLNGILADEMGLGKTIQTIALLAHLACEKQVWGPHLIVVPTSVILNWEMELKKWLPGFKIMTYYGSPRERKEKRSGWSKDNAFHVCITSYQLVLQDQNAFKRKQWQYLILDEAHHIKNFRSQRWQVLLNFNSKRRLLLTGTPLQNNLMELWSLLYFLMPNGVSQDMPIGFANLKEFQEWFSHPVDRMIEGTQPQQQDEESRDAIQKLHTVLRPYLLRRLKMDVEKQMPKKHEHIVYCRLSKRQHYLYDDFMARGKTKETLASGNFLSIINCLMQLRKVCNHPDLFEERPILTSFAMDDSIQFMGQRLEQTFRIQSKPLEHVDFDFLNLILTKKTSAFSKRVTEDTLRLEASKEMIKAMAKHQKRIAIAESRGVTSRDYHDLRKYAKYREMQMHLGAVARYQRMIYHNRFRCSQSPMYDANLMDVCFPKTNLDRTWSIQPITSYQDRIASNLEMINQIGFVTPNVVVRSQSSSSTVSVDTSSIQDIFHPIRSRLTIAFPDKRLLQYDCGKLQKLDTLLRTLAAGGHRALIFTQMTRVLDVLETFLNMHGHRYLRLDGATKVEQRQVLTEHFNQDKRILCFILSSRSGGLGINLTGADTVIFYDSDWNPSMDKQCQDRAHRIGQTRDVHIYRFVTQFTIEENIFKKANQKRMLDNVIIGQGDFTDDYFHKNEWWKDLPEVVGQDVASTNHIDYEQALLQADDENDAQAAIVARKEMNMDDHEFSGESNTPKNSTPSTTRPSTPIIEDEETENDVQLNVGHVDQYMLQFWETQVIGTDLGFGGFH